MNVLIYSTWFLGRGVKMSNEAQEWMCECTYLVSLRAQGVKPALHWTINSPSHVWGAFMWTFPEFSLYAVEIQNVLNFEVNLITLKAISNTSIPMYVFQNQL